MVAFGSFCGTLVDQITMQDKDLLHRQPGSVRSSGVSQGAGNALGIFRPARPAQSLKIAQAGAPPVYRPQAPQPLQPKRVMPCAPPVYKPAPTHPSLQAKSPAWRPGTAPPVYRVPAQSSMQAKSAVLQNSNLLAVKPNAPAQKMPQPVLPQAGVARQPGAALPTAGIFGPTHVGVATGNSLLQNGQNPIQPKTTLAPFAQMPAGLPNPRNWTPGVLQRASSFADDTPSYSGQIYGIFLNTKYPSEAKLKPQDCVYVGKTVPSDVDVGTRFLQHVREDKGKPWQVDEADDDAYEPDEDDEWEYIPRQIVDLSGKTKAEVALWESWAIQHYKKLGADLQNKVRPITVKKVKIAAAAGAIRKKHAPKKVDFEKLAEMDIT